VTAGLTTARRRTRPPGTSPRQEDGKIIDPRDEPIESSREEELFRQRSSAVRIIPTSSTKPPLGMPRYSDSNYAAVTRQRRHRNQVPTVVASDFESDWDWDGDVLEPDDVEISQHEAAVAPLLEEGELDSDAIVVSPTGNSSSAATVASERRRREEGWNDLALEHFVDSAAAAAATSNASSVAAAGAPGTGTGADPAAAAGRGTADAAPGAGTSEDPTSASPGW
jgi:hypothetical protein